MPSAAPEKFAGVWPALMTPFQDDETIDFAALGEHVAWLLGRGVHGLFICGSTAECPHLTEPERLKIAEFVLAAVGGRVPVMVHVGHTSTRVSVELAKHAAALHADAVSAVPPYYYAGSAVTAIRHWRAIGEATDLPLYIYRIPPVKDTGSLQPHIKDVLAIPHLAGMKFSDVDFFEMQALMDLAGPGFRVFSGLDEDAVCGLAAGAVGLVGTTYNILPEPFLAIYAAMRAGRAAAATETQLRVNKFFRAVFASGAGLAAWKTFGELRGLRLGRCRPPFEWVRGERREALLRAARGIGFPEAFVGAT